MPKYRKPWIGKKYGRRSYHGVGLLILGESAYDWPENGRIRTASATQIISWYWKKGQYGNSKFPRNLVKLFLPHEARTPTTLARLWDSVAYANFVQNRVGVGPKARPTQFMCRRSVDPTEALIAELAPDCIIIASRLAWNWLKGLGRMSKPLHVKGIAHETRLFRTRNAKLALAVSLVHPAWRGFKADEWKPVVDRILQTSRRRVKGDKKARPN
jgi:hypothetical protein